MASTAGQAEAAEPPVDLVEVGVVRGAYGVRGWVRIAPYAEGLALVSTSCWWLIDGEQRRRLTLASSRRHGAAVLAKWSGCESKEAADALKGAVVAVARSQFPDPAADEVYLGDLLGSRVINRAGETLGTVSGLRSSEAAGVTRQWLEVSGGEQTCLIPLVEAYVDAIDREARVVTVDWQRDWS